MYRQEAINSVKLPNIDYFKSHIYGKCKKAIEEFNMIQPGDCVAVEITWDCNTLTMSSFLMEYQRERNNDFTIEFFVETKDGTIDNQTAKVLNYIGIEKYHTVEAGHKEELYECIKAAKCNRIALHQNYNHVVKASFMQFLHRKQHTMIPPISRLEHHDIMMIRPMYMLKDHYILHWIKKVGVDVRLADEVTLFGAASLIEEGIDEKGMHSGAEYQFNVYERV